MKDDDGTNKVKEENSLLVTVEDKKEKIEEVTKGMRDIKTIKLVKKLADGTKQYSIASKDNKDIRKDIFEVFAKNEITIFELKKSEATLEEAFINLIDKEKITEKNENKKGGKK